MPMFEGRQQRGYWLTQLNAFLKVGCCLVLMLLALVLQSLPAMAVLVGALLLLLTQVRIRWTLLLYGAVSLTIFALFSGWFLGNWPKTLLSTMRLLALILPAPILMLTTNPADLIRALQVARLPGFLTLSVMLIWRFLPLILQEIQRILEANQLRGIDLKRQPQHWFAGLLVPLVFQMVAYADEVTVGLQTRGYDPQAPRSNSQPVVWRWRDTAFVGGMLVLVIGISYVAWGH